MTVAGDGPRVGADGSFLNCPRCGLSIRPKAWSFEHCPRCLGNRGIAVWMFRSPLPTAELYSDDRAPKSPERRPASQQPAGVARGGVR